MKILIDMNLSPEWCAVLERLGFAAVHWSTVGDPRATDRDLLGWARANDCVVFTHDLDFGAVLAATGAEGPSVVLVRTQDPTPAHLADLLAAALRKLEPVLQEGAIVSIDEVRARARVLPLKR